MRRDQLEGTVSDNMLLRGMPAKVHQLQVGGKRLSAIPILTTSGIEDEYVTKDRVDGTKFEDLSFSVYSQSFYHLTNLILTQ